MSVCLVKLTSSMIVPQVRIPFLRTYTGGIPRWDESAKLRIRPGPYEVHTANRPAPILRSLPCVPLFPLRQVYSRGSTIVSQM